LSAICVGACVLLGWYLSFPPLRALLPGQLEMKANTAVGLSLLGAILVLRSYCTRANLVRFLGTVVAALGLATLAESAWHLDLGIDQFLALDVWPVPQYPGRMGPGTATCLVLLAGAHLVRDLPWRSAAIASQLAAIVAGAMATITLFGYLLHVETLTGLSGFTRMALSTALAVLALSAGTVCAAGETRFTRVVASAHISGKAVRLLLSAVLTVTPLLAFLVSLGQWHGWYSAEFGVSLLALSQLVSLSIVILFGGDLLYRIDANRLKAEQERKRLFDEVQASNARLERAVQEKNRELREREQQLHDAFEFAAIGMALVSPKGHWLRVNRALCSLLGYSEAELRTLRFQELTHPDDLGSDLAFTHRILSGEMPSYQAEKRYFHKQGHPVWVLLSVSLVRAADGTALHFIAQVQDISTRKAAEQASRESEERLQLVTQGSHDGIWDWYLETDYCYFSARYLQLLGYSEGEFPLRGRFFESGVHPEDKDRFQTKLQAHFYGGQPYDAEYRLQHRSGSYRWFHARGQASWDSGGRPLRFTGALRDITDRKNAETALHLSRQFLDAVLNAIPQPMFVKDAQHRWVEFNDAFCELMGQERQALRGLSDFDLLSEEIAQRCWEEDDLTMASDEAMVFEARAAMPNGTSPWHLNSKKKVLLPNGEAYIVSVCTDVSALKQAQEALTESEARFRALVEMSSDWYWEQDEQFRFTFISQDAAQMSGHAPSASLGCTRWEHPGIDPDSANWYAHMQICQAHEPFRSFHYRRQGDDGRQRWLSINGEPVVDEHGRFKGYRGTGQDVTERTVVQEELRQHRDHLQDLVEERTREAVLAKDAAVAANRAKSEFLANMSHELRTPMHAILSFARLGVDRLEAGEVARERLQQYFRRVHQSGERLLGLLNDLLDLSKLEAGKMNYQWRRSDVRTAAQNAIAELEVMARSKSVQLRLACEESLPPIWCDNGRILQVFSNLISNAIKFSTQGSAVTVTLEPFLTNTCTPAIRSSVRDQGLGIPSDELERIFEKFAQSTRTSTGSGGTGLGLSICRQIVHDHHGHIWAENNQHGGACVSFLLPVERREVSTQATQDTPPPPPTESMSA
jgi:PAS domain S-box-containing protein